MNEQEQLRLKGMRSNATTTLKIPGSHAKESNTRARSINGKDKTSSHHPSTNGARVTKTEVTSRFGLKRPAGKTNESAQKVGGTNSHKQGLAPETDKEQQKPLEEVKEDE